MPVKKDASGRRSVEAEADVPGTPEEVWTAIATGPGISSWFVPSEVDGRIGGTALSHFASDGSMDSLGRITAWEPPRRFAVETQEGPGPVATEWTVEAKSGGQCTVRVVHSWFASSDDWDGQFEGHSYGWVFFFRILRLYLTHFPGKNAVPVQLLAMSSEPTPKAWEMLVAPLGLSHATEQQRVKAPADAPPFAGVVERVGPAEYPELVLRLDQPAPALAHLFVLPMGQTFLSVRLFVFGDEAANIAERQQGRWRTWLDAHFPPPTVPAPVPTCE
jgi:uncharacterized protein YndB with AHSA1/START domain